MAAGRATQLLLLHALPLDGSMWAAQADVLPGATHAPTLYGFGDTLDAWAEAVLTLARGDRIVVVGCSVGGSCALELASLAPGRIAALVLIGTKARHDPDPAFHASALEVLREEGLERAWRRYWEPLFSRVTPAPIVDAAHAIALRQERAAIERGVTAFHSRASREDVVAALDCPVVFVTGDDDRAPGPRACATQAALARHGQLHTIARCGHYVPLEQPEALNAILRAVIAQCDA